MTQYSIPVVLGTARENRNSQRAAQFIVRQLSERDDIDTQLVDVRDHVSQAMTVPPWGEGGANDNPTEWKSIVESADALILVIPEYNHGYPGELKLLLDSLYDEYSKMPVALCGVSGGGFGGTRAVEHIKPVLLELGMIPAGTAFYVSRVKKSIDENGEAENKEQLDEGLSRMLEELLWHTKVVNSENITS